MIWSVQFQDCSPIFTRVYCTVLPEILLFPWLFKARERLRYLENLPVPSVRYADF